jgi:PAS domain S-box-containing protein
MEFTRSKITSITLGITFLILVPLWIWLVVPELLKLPGDFSFTADIISVDDLYDEERNVYSGGIYSKTQYSYKTVKSEYGVSIVKNTFKVHTPDDQLIFEVERLLGIDRKTGAHVIGYGDKNREGYLFAPRHLSSDDSFTYWHINYDGPAQMYFAGEERLYNLTTYRFETRYEGVPIDQTENLGFLPKVGTTRGIELEPYLQIWVEPMTGRLIKYKDDTVAYYYDLETHERLSPWNHFSNTLHERSVEANVHAAKSARTKAQVVEWYIPAILLFLSFFFFGKNTGINTLIQNFASIERVRVLVGILVAGVGIVSLLGWTFDIDALIRIVPTANAINPTTAVCFITLGIAFLVTKIARGRITIILGLVIACIGTLRLLESFGWVDIHIDLLLLRDTVLNYEFPALMAQYAAFSFMIIGLVPLSFTTKVLKRFRFAEIFSSLVFFFSIVAIVGLLFASLEFLTIPDFFSAAIHTPLLLLISSAFAYAYWRERDKYSLGLKGWLSVSSILIVSVLITISFASTLNIFLTNDARDVFTIEVDRTTQAFEERIAIYMNALEGAKGLHAASQYVDRDEWKIYVDSLEIQKNYPGIQGVGYSVFVKPENLEAHIAAIRTEGFPNYTIKPEGNRSIYTSIIYLEPFDVRNQQAFGYDMFSNDVRRSAMEQARDTGEPKMSGRITLVQEIDEDVQPGFSIYIPYYKNSAPHETLEERRANIVGYSYAPFRAHDFVAGVIGESGIPDIGLRIEDGTSGSVESILYDDSGKKVPVFNQARFRDSRTIYTAGRPWVLTFVSSPTYGETAFSRLIIPVVVVVGITISMLISLIFYTLFSSRQQAIAYADQVTKNIKEAKAKDEAMLASIGDGFIATDKDGVIVLVNKVFESIFGWESKEVYGKKLADVVAMFDERGKEVPESNRLITEALTQTTTTAALQYKKKDGSLFPVAVTVSPIILEGTVIGAVEIFRDVTKEKQIDKAKTEFVSLASHQLRTPLSTVSWYTEMLLAGDAGKITKEQKKYLKEVYISNQRMVELVNALLNVSRLELGTFAVKLEPTDIVAVIRSVVKEQKPQINAKKQQVQFEFANNLPILQADPKLLGIVFQNLLSNAIKYTEENGVIRLSVSLEGTDIVATVSDNGWGIPKDQQDKIFTKFFRADNVKEQDTEGTGLGLYIVKSIVEYSGGHVSFQSEETKGTTFRISLPKTGMQKKEGSKTLD